MKQVSNLQKQEQENIQGYFHEFIQEFIRFQGSVRENTREKC